MRNAKPVHNVCEGSNFSNEVMTHDTKGVEKIKLLMEMNRTSTFYPVSETRCTENYTMNLHYFHSLPLVHVIRFCTNSLDSNADVFRIEMQ